MRRCTRREIRTVSILIKTETSFLPIDSKLAWSREQSNCRKKDEGVRDRRRPSDTSKGGAPGEPLIAASVADTEQGETMGIPEAGQNRVRGTASSKGSRSPAAESYL